MRFFTAGDDATTDLPVVQAPGEPYRGVAPLAQELARGNVVLVTLDAAQTPALRRLAADVGGPDEPALRAAGQAVIVEAPDPATLGLSEPECADRQGRATACPTITAYARGRRYATAKPGDPALRAFVEYWLGRAAG